MGGGGNLLGPDRRWTILTAKEARPDPVPDDEEQRLQALDRYDILDTEPEQGYDDLVDLAAAICGTPTALISLVDEDRLWFKACRGYDESEIPREESFCAQAIVHPDEVMVVEDADEDARFAENLLVTGDAGVRFYAGAPIVTPDGYALGTICVLDTEPRGISDGERRALQALSRHVARLLELRRTRAEVHAFAAAVSEDLRDPLMAVIGNLEMIEGAADGTLDDRSRRRFADALQAADRLEGLIDALTDYAATGSADPRTRRRVDLDEALDQVRVDLAPRIEELEAEVVADDLPSVEADPDQIHYVMLHLVRNALQAAGEDPPRIEVRSRRDDGRWRITITDEGTAIDPGELQALLDVTQRSAASRLRDAGIRLVLAKRFVEGHGGRLVARTGEDGTTFAFSLPAADASGT